MEKYTPIILARCQQGSSERKNNFEQQGDDCGGNDKGRN